MRDKYYIVIIVILIILNFYKFYCSNEGFDGVTDLNGFDNKTLLCFALYHENKFLYVLLSQILQYFYL